MEENIKTCKKACMAFSKNNNFSLKIPESKSKTTKPAQDEATSPASRSLKEMQIDLHKEPSFNVSLKFSFHDYYLILEIFIFRVQDSPSKRPANRINIPNESITIDRLESILENVWSNSSQRIIDTFANLSTSFVMRKDRLNSINSTKSDSDYCLNIGSVVFDWSPRDNLYVHSDKRLSKNKERLCETASN